jgi:tRNA 2-selenouridine synthase SelU
MIIIESEKKAKSKEIHTLCVNHKMIQFFIVIILNKKDLYKQKISEIFIIYI